jgi:hypothetical protein
MRLCRMDNAGESIAVRAGRPHSTNGAARQGDDGRTLPLVVCVRRLTWRSCPRAERILAQIAFVQDALDVGDFTACRSFRIWGERRDQADGGRLTRDRQAHAAPANADSTDVSARRRNADSRPSTYDSSAARSRSASVLVGAATHDRTTAAAHVWLMPSPRPI